MNDITKESILGAFMHEVLESIEKVEDVQKQTTAWSEPKVYEPRVNSRVGGCFWGLIHVARGLDSYSEKHWFEERAKAFLDRHCKNVIETYEVTLNDE